MASFRIYKALPVEVYQRLMQESHRSPEQSYQPVLPSTSEIPHPINQLDPELHSSSLETEYQDEGQQPSSTARVLSLLPHRQQERSKKIIEVLQRCQIAWDSLGQLTDGKVVISGSNIVDLLNFLTCTIPPRNAQLTGLGPMVSALKKYNAPLCLFGKEGKKVLSSENPINEMDKNTMEGKNRKRKASTIPGWTSCEKFKIFKK